MGNVNNQNKTQIFLFFLLHTPEWTLALHMQAMIKSVLSQLKQCTPSPNVWKTEENNWIPPYLYSDSIAIRDSRWEDNRNSPKIKTSVVISLMPLWQLTYFCPLNFFSSYFAVMPQWKLSRMEGPNQEDNLMQSCKNVPNFWLFCSVTSTELEPSAVRWSLLLVSLVAR